MPTNNPRSLEVWAKGCHDNNHAAYPWPNVMCLACARAYAVQVQGENRRCDAHPSLVTRYCSDCLPLTAKPFVEAAVAQVRQEEREACAKRLEEVGCTCEHRVTPKRDPHSEDCPWAIAAALRAREP